MDHHHNFIIVHPDVLVSGTRVILPADSSIVPMSLLLRFHSFNCSEVL